MLVGVASLVLLATGVPKLLDATVANPYYEQSNSLFPFFNNRQIMVLAGFLETGLAIYLWRKRVSRHSALVLLWFCSLVLLYKIGLKVTYATQPCACLGALGKALHLSNQGMDRVTWTLLGCLMMMGVGAYVRSDSAAEISAATRNDALHSPEGNKRVAN